VSGGMSVVAKREAKATVAIVCGVSKWGSRTARGRRCSWVSVVDHCARRRIASICSKVPQPAGCLWVFRGVG
jgi:hypothetical protein